MDYKIDKPRHHKGLKSDFYTAKVIYKSYKLHITYDCNNQNLIIHEWYKLSRAELSQLTYDILTYFNNLTE